MNTSIKDFDKFGFVRIVYPRDLRLQVKKTLGLWQEFTKLPLEVKLSLPYSNNSRGVGYEFKDGSGNKGDRKENFDVAFGSKQWLDENVGKISEPIVGEFLINAFQVVEGLKPLVFNFAAELEGEFGISGLHKEVLNGADFIFVRLIHYFPDREVGEEIASSHVDQGGFTPHLGETAPGLQFLSREGEWFDMPQSEEETVIIPSMQLQLRSEGKLRATNHRVVATEKTAEEGRYSAVCFVGLRETPSYNKEKWGRLQEMEPGFNYNIPPQEFKKFFKS